MLSFETPQRLNGANVDPYNTDGTVGTPAKDNESNRLSRDHTHNYTQNYPSEAAIYSKNEYEMV